MRSPSNRPVLDLMLRRVLRVLTAAVRSLENMDEWIGRVLGRGLGSVIEHLGLSGRAAMALAAVPGGLIGFAIYGLVR